MKFVRTPGKNTWQLRSNYYYYYYLFGHQQTTSTVKLGKQISNSNMEVNKTKQTKTKNGRGKGKRAGNRAGGIKGKEGNG